MSLSVEVLFKGNEIILDMSYTGQKQYMRQWGVIYNIYLQVFIEKVR